MSSFSCFRLFGQSAQVNPRHRGKNAGEDEEEEPSFDVLRRGLEFQAHGEFEKAKLHMMAAVSARRYILTAAHPSTIAAIAYLGLLLRDMGEKEDAVTNLKEAVEGRRNLLGDEHHKTRVIVDALAELLMAEDKWDEVRDLPGYENATAKVKKKGGVCSVLCGGGADADDADEDTKEEAKEEEIELDDEQKQELLDDADDNLGEAIEVIEKAHPDHKTGEDKRRVLRESIAQAALARFVTRERTESGITIPGGDIRCIENELITSGTAMLRTVVAKAALERTTKRLELAAEAAAKEAKELHEDFFGFVPSREHIAGLKHALARTEAAELTKENDKQVKEALKALNQAVTAVTEATGEEHVKAPHDHRHEYVERGSLVRILKSKDVRLVKPEYLLSLHEAGEIIPKRQALPEDAFVDFDDAGGEAKAEAIQIICLSYCWLSDDHPDPDGYHLATIAALLKCFMKGSPDKVNARGYMMSRVSASAMAQAGAAARKKLLWDAKKLMLAEDLQNMGDFCFGAGDGRPVGVFMDWTSAYQKELTTAEEKHSFEAYMKHINLWYAHESTIVWALDYPPEVLPRGGKNVKYQKSGWGAFEHRLGQMISPQSAVLNITDETRSLLLAPKVPKKEPDVYVKKQPRFKEKLTDKKLEDWRTYRYVAAGDYIQLALDTMELDRGVPLVPKTFKKMLEDQEFSHDADSSDVNHKYHATFGSLFTHATQVSFAKTGINDDLAVARKLVHFLEHNCKVLTELDMSGNPKLALPLEDWATFARGVELEKLRLDQCSGIAGDVIHLGVAELLTDVSLTGTSVTGDVGTCAALVNLASLNFKGTAVTGDVTPLAGLVGLKELCLQSTAVSGDVGLLCSLVNVTILRMEDTNVSGDIAPLAELASLQELRLDRSAVSGEVGALVPVEGLAVLSLQGTNVSGDLMPLLELEHLGELQLQGTDVTGDEAAFRQELAAKGRTMAAVFDASMKPHEEPTEDGGGGDAAAGDVATLPV